MDAILLQPLPYVDADRLVALRHAAPGLGLTDAGQSDGTYLHYRSNSRAFEDIALYYENVVNLTGGADDAERVPIAMVSPSLFELLGARAALGRLPVAADSASAEILVLMSHDLWRRRYGSDPAVVGGTIEANGVPRRVIGVLEPRFDFPRREIALWYPTTPEPTGASVSDLSQDAVGRLRPGVTEAQAEADLNRLIPSLPVAYPDASPALFAEAGLRARVEPLERRVVGDAAGALWTLLGAMGLLLLIACANVVNLFLVRAEHRQRESAVRAALGAGRVDLLAPLLAEGLLLGVGAAALGLAAAAAAVQALLAYGPQSVPRLHEVHVGARVWLFAGALGVASGLVFGSLTALRRRPPLSVSLKDSVRGATAGRQRQHARRILVGAQLALALTLLVGSALLARSFWQLRSANPGFRADNVLTAEIALPFRGYETYEKTYQLWSAVLEQVRAHPAVDAAGAVTALPLVAVPDFWKDELTLARVPDAGAPASRTVTFYHVTDGYFEAMGIPVLSGALPGSDGVAERERPVVLSAAVAARLPGSGLGEALRRGSGPEGIWSTVTAVVGDVPASSIGGAPADVVYVPVLESPVDEGWSPGYMTLVVRTTAAPESLAPVIRDVVRSIDPTLPVANVRTLERVVAGSMARTTFAMLLLLVAAAAALLLGTVGVYGVTSYAASRRTHEVGIRIALGARRQDVERMILSDGAGVAVAGIAAGFAAALLLTRWLRSLLYQVSAWDPLAFVGTALLLLATALLATWLPARRAARTNPLDALRSE